MSDVLVAGGGLAGGAAALSLARGGWRVTLFERSAAPTDKICGEFLGSTALACLARLGIDPFGLGARPISRVRLVRGRRIVETPLGFAAAGLSRRRLDEALLDAAERAGAKVVRGATIRSARATTLDLVSGGEVRGGALFLATGKHDLRGARRDAPDDRFVGFKTHLRLAPRHRTALDGVVELILLPDAYIGLNAVEDGRVNVCLLVDRARLAAADGRWETLRDDLAAASPLFRSRLEGAAEAWSRPLAIAGVPYGYVHRPTPEDRAFRLGDQIAVIPSFTGEGMGIALRTAELGTSSFMAGADPAAYHHFARRRVAAAVRTAWWLYRIGRTNWGQAAMAGLLRACPGGLRVLAAATRAG